jgi:hypothetical protein
MKTSKVLFSFLMLGAVMFLFSCGGAGSSGSPSSTIKEFIHKVEKSDFEGALGCIALEGKTLDKDSKGKLMLLISMAKGELDKKKGMKSMDVITETIAPDGNNATVKMKLTYGDGSTNEEDYKLVKEEGKWKLKMK